MKSKTSKKQRFLVSRKFIKFSRKSMEVSPMNIVIGAAILGAVLFIFFYAIFPIFTGKQIPWIKGQVDQTTTDCDGDGLIGLNDECPCTAESKSGENKACPSANKASETNCPNYCKIFGGGSSGGAGASAKI